jgi:hypothetical protein
MENKTPYTKRKTWNNNKNVLFQSHGTPYCRALHCSIGKELSDLRNFNTPISHFIYGWKGYSCHIFLFYLILCCCGVLLCISYITLISEQFIRTCGWYKFQCKTASGQWLVTVRILWLYLAVFTVFYYKGSE